MAQALDDHTLPQATRELLTLALHAAEQLERTVRSLLALARERPPTAMARAVPVRALLEDVIVEQATALDGRPVSLQVDVPDSARITAPDDELRIIVSNLIGNALVHAAPGAIVVRWMDGALEIANPRWPEEPAMSRPVADPANDATAHTSFGFGLDIARRLAARSDLAVQVLDTDASHYCVRLGSRA